MRQGWVRLAALLVVGVGAWVGLSAREDKADLPDDLARVPAKAQGVVSLRFAGLWSSGLVKDFRKGLGKEAEQELFRGLEHTEKTLGLKPEHVERVTFVVSDLIEPEHLAVIARVTKPINIKTVAAMVEGREETVGGQTVYASRGTLFFAADGGKTYVFGARAAVEPMLKAKAARPTGALAAMLAKASRHHVAAYIDPTAAAAARADELPPELAAAKPLIATRDAVAWLDVGYTTRLGLRMTFADDKAAGRGRKALDAGRALASLTLSGMGDMIAGKSKPIAALLTKVETMLDEASVEQKEAAVEAALELKVAKADVAAVIKEMTGKLVEAAARARAQNNLKQIGIALHSYHDANGTFPPAAVYDKDGKAVLSWRVLILPYLESDGLYKQFRLDEPWDSDHNKKLLARIPSPYVAPVGKASAAGGTFYQAFYGKGAAFEGKRGIRITDIFDGTSNTILVAEAAKDVPWTKPDDLPFDAGGKLPKLGGLYPGGFNALLGDGSVRFIKATIPADTLKALITRGGGEVITGDY